MSTQAETFQFPLSETFQFPLLPEISIEDYQDGKPARLHFMADRTHKRYRVWSGGCGGWSFDTVEEARQFIFEQATQRLLVMHLDHQVAMLSAEKALRTLGDDTFNIAHFIKQEEC